eukprot:gnl/TRDRNA2_/TRDRNA2_158896_c0_seq2.p1 gnl/TRDRNA2_/TRDRNA2_158896_c0~~gnl/TRDRNA2_/TRDRNA2_158896_c0_seq2.p1  ORF type:complete len:350 (+),score=50.35 gnl/TRDRNA2_/TRDRNA2_158896_c0_seq2:76-1125(+)
MPPVDADDLDAVELFEHEEIPQGPTTVGIVPDDSILPDGVQDGFDRLGVCSETIEIQTLSEQRSLRLSQRPSAAPLNRLTRQIALSFMQLLLKRLELKSSDWFSAATLLDTYRPPVSRLPTTCAALVNIVKKNKFAKRDEELKDMELLTSESAKMAKYLHQCGFANGSSDVSKEDIYLEERRVLRDLSWEINLPTIESWVSSCCMRLKFLVDISFATPIERVKELSLQNGQTVVMHTALGCEFPPQKVAYGLFCLGLVGVQMLPLDVFRPEEVDPEDFEELLMCVSSCRPQLHTSVPQCPLASENWQAVARMVSVATGASIPELQQCTDRIARIIMECLVDIDTQRSVH